MIWQLTSPGRWEADNYTIERDENYHYQLTHRTEGKVMKYRLLEGAQRAAERHAKGERKGKGWQKEQPSRERIKATIAFIKNAVN